MKLILYDKNSVVKYIEVWVNSNLANLTTVGYNCQSKLYVLFLVNKPKIFCELVEELTSGNIKNTNTNWKKGANLKLYHKMLVGLNSDETSCAPSV